jgi:hypothetical protein
VADAGGPDGAGHSPPASARIALAGPPPWAPVAPNTAIIFLSAMAFVPSVT